MTEEHNRNFEQLQERVKQQRQKIKAFDLKQEEKKGKEFDVSLVKKLFVTVEFFNFCSD